MFETRSQLSKTEVKVWNEKLEVKIQVMNKIASALKNMCNTNTPLEVVKIPSRREYTITNNCFKLRSRAFKKHFDVIFMVQNFLSKMIQNPTFSFSGERYDDWTINRIKFE